jgi:hypothetical protein
MEINNKEELLKAIEDLQSRLAIVEDGLSKDEPAGEDEPAEETEAKVDEAEAEVESEDEIEKLLEG